MSTVSWIVAGFLPEASEAHQTPVVRVESVLVRLTAERMF